MWEADVLIEGRDGVPSDGMAHDADGMAHDNRADGATAPSHSTSFGKSPVWKDLFSGSRLSLMARLPCLAGPPSAILPHAGHI